VRRILRDSETAVLVLFVDSEFSVFSLHGFSRFLDMSSGAFNRSVDRSFRSRSCPMQQLLSLPIHGVCRSLPFLLLLYATYDQCLSPSHSACLLGTRHISYSIITKGFVGLIVNPIVIVPPGFYYMLSNSSITTRQHQLHIIIITIIIITSLITPHDFTSSRYFPPQKKFKNHDRIKTEASLTTH